MQRLALCKKPSNWQSDLSGVTFASINTMQTELKYFNDGRDWFFENRFGLFIHWGLYAIPAWHEQLQWRAGKSREYVAELAKRWNPTEFDVNEWLDAAEACGMSYLVFTAKHHDGFCLWDTKQTDFNCMNTPYGQDILQNVADTCHRRNIPLSVYYSCVDWKHPNYPNQGRHHELPGPLPEDEPDLEKYINFVKAQVKEICSNYGELHGFWWDMNVDEHQDPSVNAIIRELQPNAIINNRGYDEGDISTPERDFGNIDKITPNQPVEACQSIGKESWGYRKNEDYYSLRHLIKSIDRYRSQGANYLLNVGPMASGKFPPEGHAMLDKIGPWYHATRESFEGTVYEPCISQNTSVFVTRRKNTLYIHLNEMPVCKAVKLAPLALLPQSAVLLNDGRSVSFAVDMLPSEHMEKKVCLRLKDLPVDEMAHTVMVIKLEFDELPEIVLDPGITHQPSTLFTR